MRKLLSSALLAGVLLVPAAVMAQDEHRDRAETHRYYDPYKKDYHEWNDGEQRAWEHWAKDVHHGEARDFARASKKQQQEYWKWRHDNPNWDRH